MNKFARSDETAAEGSKSQLRDAPSNLLSAGKNLFGKVGGLLGKSNDKELSMMDQDIRILEKDLAHLEAAMPDRRDILNKVRLLIKDNLRLKEMLAESNKIDSDSHELDNLLLAQVLEYERDKLDWSKSPGTAGTVESAKVAGEPDVLSSLREGKVF